MSEYAPTVGFFSDIASLETAPGVGFITMVEAEDSRETNSPPYILYESI